MKIYLFLSTKFDTAITYDGDLYFNDFEAAMKPSTLDDQYRGRADLDMLDASDIRAIRGSMESIGNTKAIGIIDHYIRDSDRVVEPA